MIMSPKAYCRTIWIWILFFQTVAPSFAQRRGAIDTGGYFAFRSLNENDSTKSLLDIDWSFGYYLNNNFLIEIQPTIRLDILNNQIKTSNLFLSNFSLRLIDMEPDEYRRSRHLKHLDRTTAGIFIFCGGGVWYEGRSGVEKESDSVIGPAFSLGIATQTPLGKIMLAKTKLQYVYLAPSGSPYDSARTLFKIGAGLSIFIRI